MGIAISQPSIRIMQQYFLSNRIFYNNTSEKSQYGETLVKLKAITLTTDLPTDTLGISFDIKGGDSAWASAQIYLNGIYTGESFTGGINVYKNVTRTIDFGRDLLDGDNIEIWARAAAPTETVYVKSFRFLGEFFEFPSIGEDNDP